MKVDNKNLPDFLCIGAPKSGTTALYEYLSYVDDISLHKEIKEPNYLFIRQLDEIAKNKMDFSSSIAEEDKYIEFFNRNSNKITGDISPNYMIFPEMVLRSINELYGDYKKDLKIIVILRNPIDRVVSQYNMFLREEIENKDFEEAIFNEEVQELMKKNKFEIYNKNENNWPVYNFDYMLPSFYYKNLLPYFKELNQDNIKIILFEDFIQNTYDVLDEILGFLGSKYKFDRNIKLNKVGQGGKVKSRYKFIHRIFTKKNIVKELIKPVVPFSIRKKIKTSVLENKKMYEKYQISNELRKKLYEDYFKEDIEQLEKLLNIDLSHWKYE